jgi:GNAT superfamily N-acetyltransferase
LLDELQPPPTARDCHGYSYSGLLDCRSRNGLTMTIPSAETWLELKAGRYLLRPLRPEDAPTLRGFFYSHTPETIHQRYGYTLKDMSAKRAGELAGIDQSRDRALGIFEERGSLQILHAIGRYCLDPDGTGAEVALVVREAKRRKGMAHALLKALVDTARARGLDSLWAQILPDNRPVLEVLKHHGAVRLRSGEPGSVRLRIDLRK